MAHIRWRLALLRSVIWALIGAIYAPLFISLLILLTGFGLDSLSYPVAAALAGGASAVLYGAHELALLSTGMGVAIGLGVLVVLPKASLTEVLMAAAILATAVGLSFAFPHRCTCHVPAKLLAGMGWSGITGAALSYGVARGVMPESTLWLVILLVGINGPLYVLTIRGWILLSLRLGLESWPRDLIESLVMAILASIAAGSIWLLFVPILGTETEFWRSISLTIHQEIFWAILGGLISGVATGLLLEALRLPWVHEL